MAEVEGDRVALHRENSSLCAAYLSSSYEELAQDSAAESERYRLELRAVHEEYQKERKELERRHGVRMLEMELRIG